MIIRSNERRTLEEIENDLYVVLDRLLRGREPWPLFLHGASGLGKTFAALAVADWVVGAVAYTELGGFCEFLIRQMRGESSGRHFDIPRYKYWSRGFSDDWDAWRRCELAILDELGTTECKPFRYDTAKRMIDERNGQPLIIISNLDLEKISAVYDDRMASRCKAGTVVEIQGEDRRGAR